MRVIEIPDSPDDLRFASEAIQKIAEQSIQSIVDLYSLKFSSQASSNASDELPRSVPVNEIDIPRTFTVRENTSNTIERVEVPPTISTTPRDNKEPLIDANLHNLVL